MNFFQQLAEMAQGLDLTIKVNEKNGTLTIEVLPGNVDTLRPVRLRGTPKDVDEGIIEAIRKPLELVKGLQVDTSDFEMSVTKGLDKSVAKNTTQPKPAPKAQAKPASKVPVRPADNKKAEETPAIVPPAQEPPVEADQQTKNEEEVTTAAVVPTEEPKAEEPTPVIPEAPKVDDAPKKPVELSIF